MSRRRTPRRAGEAAREIAAHASPRTLLAEVQGAWPNVCGTAIAAEAQPVSERDGVVTVACRSATWASELDLMQQELRRRLEAEIGTGRLTRLRFTADAARHERA